MKTRHIMWTWKILTDLFWQSCLQCFSSKNVLNNHTEVCLSILGLQSLKLEKGTISWVWKLF